MRKMKDSGFEWLGDIPNHWNLTRIGNLYRVRNQKVSDKDFPPLSVTMKGILPQLETAAKTNDGDNRKLVRVGDFAINSRSDRRGSCGISSLDGSVSLINTVLMPLGEMNPRYYNWLFHTVQFADEYYKCGHGIVDDLWTTTWQEMRKIVIPTPPIIEQEKIAAFLDTKCAEIDMLISDIRDQIDTLELYKKSIISEKITKGVLGDVDLIDSGIDYIGNIADPWKFTRIGYICQKLTRRFSSDADALICSNKGEVVLRGDTTIGLVSDSDNMFQGVRTGDLLIHGMDTWHGAIAVSRLDGKCTNVVHVCDSYENKKFIAYYLQMLAFKKVYKAISNGVRGNTSDFRSWEKVKKIYISLPERSEQDSIVRFLDEKCGEIVSIIKDKQEQIGVLEAYKKSLIFEYITGKKEV